MANKNTIQITLEVDDKGTVKVKEFGDSTKKTLDDTSEASKKGKTALDALHDGWVVFTAKVYLAREAYHVVKSALYDSTVAIAAQTSEIQKQARFVGMSTDELQRWQFAARMSHVDAQEFSFGLRLLSRNMEDASQGAGDASKYFKMMGIDIKDSSGNLKPLSTTMKEIADKFATWEDGPRKIAIALALFGRGGEALISILNQGRAGIEKYSNELERMGGIVSEKAIKAGEELHQKITRLDSKIQAIRMNSAPTRLALANMLEGFLEKLNTIAQWFSDHPQINNFLMYGADYQHVLRQGGQKGYWEALQPESAKNIQNLTPPPELPRDEQALKAKQQMNELSLKFWAFEEQNYGRAFENEQQLEFWYKDRLNLKIKEIQLSKDLLEPEKQELINLEKALAFQEARDRARGREEALLQNQLETMGKLAALMPEVQAADLLGAPDERDRVKKDLDDYNKKLKEEDQWFDNLVKKARALAEEPEIKFMANIAPPDETDKAKRALDDYEKTLKRIQLMPQIKAGLGEISGDWNLMLTGQKEMLQIEMDRIIKENGLTGIYKEQVEQLYKLKNAELEAQRTLNFGVLVEIGAKKAQIQSTRDLADTYEKILPDSVHVFGNSLKEFFKTGKMNWKSFTDGMLDVWANVLTKMAEKWITDFLSKIMFGGSGGGGLGGFIDKIFGGGSGLTNIWGNAITTTGYSEPGLGLGGGGGYMEHAGKGPNEVSSYFRIVPSGSFFGARRFHEGFAPDEYPAILRRNESVLTPAQMRAVGNTSISISVPITIDGQVSKKMISELRAEIEGTVVQVLKRHM